MSNFGFDSLSPWRRLRLPPEDLPVPAVDTAVPGLAGWQPTGTPMAEPAPDSASPATEAGPLTPDFGFGNPSPWRRFRPPDAVSGLAGWQPTATGTAQSAPDNVPPAAEATSYPWWEQSAGPNSVFDGRPEPHRPWLRAPTDEVPRFRLNPDGSVRTDEPAGKVKLMAGALTPLNPQEQLDDATGSNGMTSSDVAPYPPTGALPAATSAASIAVPASAGGAIDLAAVAARAAPALASAGSAAVASLPFLLIPTNTQSETTDLGDGLRARVRPGQRTVEIERRVGNGLFGTGIMAKWEALPVEAWQHVGGDGSVNTVINHEQLNRVLGRNAPAESKAAGTSAMAQSPKAPQHVPPPGITSTAEGANNAGNAAQSLTPAKVDAKAFEEAKQRESDEERVLACRAVRVTPEQPAPSVHYNGPGAIDTAVNVNVAPGFPAPKGGYGYDADYLRHYNGYKGELELKNRIEKAVPYEKIIHYANRAGEHGPDVMSIGPKGFIMEWNSRSRQAPRRITRPGIPSVKYAQAFDYVSGDIEAGALSDHVGKVALDELSGGNYDVCTVGTGNAYDGYYQAVRNHIPTKPQR